MRRYCQKFSNIFPFPVEEQNCCFEPKKISKIKMKTRPKKAKKYSHTKDCKEQPREVCDQYEKGLAGTKRSRSREEGDNMRCSRGTIQKKKKVVKKNEKKGVKKSRGTIRKEKRMKKKKKVAKKSNGMIRRKKGKKLMTKLIKKVKLRLTHTGIGRSFSTSSPFLLRSRTATSSQKRSAR